MDQKSALRVARLLIDWGVPIFRAEPDLDELGIWRERGGSGGTGYWLPRGWETTSPDQGVIDAWRPGDALCAVMGVVCDVIDVDPHKDGSGSMAWLVAEGLLPRVWGLASTASGGTHSWVQSVGVRSWDGLLRRDGLDLKAGLPDGAGRGFVFIPPTVKVSKVTGVASLYQWIDEPDLDEVVLIGESSGSVLRARIDAERTVGSLTNNYSGADYDDLPSGLQALARAEIEHQTAEWIEVWAEMIDLPEGAGHPTRGGGWEKMARDWAWTVACRVAARWSPLDDADGEMLHELVLPPAVAQDRVCAGKYTEALVTKAEGYLDAPWPAEWALGGGDDSGGGGAGPPGGGAGSGAGRGLVDVTNPADALVWLQQAIGTGPLSGMFRRDSEVVFTARIGEEGYREAPPGEDWGPATVKPIKAIELATRVDIRYRVIKRARVGSTRMTATLFPADVATRALSIPNELPNLRWLRGVTHTPVIRSDGTILDRPGYDEVTGVLYLPVPGLSVPGVPDRPTARQVSRAALLIMEMICDFPFITPVDKANYIGGALLTPLLRPMFPPPYKLMGIGAPQPGSGKSLLASVSRALHGGVFKSEFPSPEEEVRKFITTVLSQTTAPVVQFDNVTGVLRSSSLEGLLTSAEWSDRRLGETGMVVMPNDRLWVLTGNNLRIAGDLGRRVLWSLINVGAPNPELRSGFLHAHLESWVIEHRGELLAALLTIVRAWVLDGGPVGAEVESSGYGDWLTGVRGIVASAGFDDSVGLVADTGAAHAVDAVDGDSVELGVLLAAIHRVFGTSMWTVGDVLEKVDKFENGENPEVITLDELPEMVADKFERSASDAGARRTFGKWMDFRQGRWAGQLSVKRIGVSRTGNVQWRLKGQV